MSIHTDIERIKDEEARIAFTTFDHDLAYRIGIGLHEEAQVREASVAIDVRAFGQQLFHLAMPGTAADNDQWIARKSALVLRLNKSSFLVGRELAAAGNSLEDRYYISSLEYSAHGGSFPIRLKSGGLIGAATVSGLPQEEDHALVVSVLERFANEV